MACQGEPSHAVENEGEADAGSRKKAPRARRRTFYRIGYKAYTKVRGMKLLNKAEVFANGPPIIFTPPGLNERGFRSYPVTPRFHLSKRFGRIPADIEQYGFYWLVSNRAKDVLSQLSPADFAFMALDTEVDPGQSPVKYWLCDIIRLTDAIDLAKSDVRIEKDDRGDDFIALTPQMKLSFKEYLLKDYCTFRLQMNSFAIICNDIFKDTLKAAGITGLNFKDLTPR